MGLSSTDPTSTPPWSRPCALASGHGSPRPRWRPRARPTRRRASIPDLGSSTWGPRTGRRCDIDVAMLDALARPPSGPGGPVWLDARSPSGNQLQVVGPRRESAADRSRSPSACGEAVAGYHPRRCPGANVALPSCSASAPARRQHDGTDGQCPSERSPTLHAHRTIAVNMKLQGRVDRRRSRRPRCLADSCFCQSHEAAVLDRIFGVIDEFDDVIRALHDAPRGRRSQASARRSSVRKGEELAFRKVFVPAGRGAIFRERPHPRERTTRAGGQP